MITTPLARPRSLGDRLRHFFLDPEGAEVALEFTSLALVGARVESRRGKVELRSLVSEPLSPGTLYGIDVADSAQGITTQFLHATGIAYAAKLRGEPSVAYASCGEGSTSTLAWSNASASCFVASRCGSPAPM